MLLQGKDKAVEKAAMANKKIQTAELYATKLKDMLEEQQVRLLRTLLAYSAIAKLLAAIACSDVQGAPVICSTQLLFGSS